MEQMKRVILCPCVLPVTLRLLHEKVEDGTGRGGQNLCDFFMVQRAWDHARKNTGSNVNRLKYSHEQIIYKTACRHQFHQFEPFGVRDEGVKVSELVIFIACRNISTAMKVIG
jgi:hypothetical protein